MTQHDRWQTYDWTDYFRQNQQSNHLLRAPGLPWEPEIPGPPNYPLYKKTAPNWDAYDDAVEDLWKKWLYFQREEGRRWIKAIYNQMYAAYGLLRMNEEEYHL